MKRFFLALGAAALIGCSADHVTAAKWPKLGVMNIELAPRTMQISVGEWQHFQADLTVMSYEGDPDPDTRLWWTSSSDSTLIVTSEGYVYGIRSNDAPVTVCAHAVADSSMVGCATAVVKPSNSAQINGSH